MTATLIAGVTRFMSLRLPCSASINTSTLPPVSYFHLSVMICYTCIHTRALVNRWYDISNRGLSNEQMLRRASTTTSGWGCDCLNFTDQHSHSVLLPCGNQDDHPMLAPGRGAQAHNWTHGDQQNHTCSKHASSGSMGLHSVPRSKQSRPPSLHSFQI